MILVCKLIWLFMESAANAFYERYYRQALQVNVANDRIIGLQ